ncbi:MAG: hypothetical protein AAFP92_30405 [Bacteroidota bacterium]
MSYVLTDYANRALARDERRKRNTILTVKGKTKTRKINLAKATQDDFKFIHETYGEGNMWVKQEKARGVAPKDQKSSGSNEAKK